MMNFIGQLVHKLRPWVYKSGLRPKRGSIWYSPLRALVASHRKPKGPWKLPKLK